MSPPAASLLLLLLLSAPCSSQSPDEAPPPDRSASQSPDGGPAPSLPHAGEDATAAILRMNNGSGELLLEGDLLVPRTRNAMRCYSKTFSCRWPKSERGTVDVPFIISPKYSPAERKEILDAMTDFHTKTCVRFVPRRRHRMYLSLEPRNGCFTTMGRLGVRQVVSLQRGGCVRRGVIQHELLHVLGFYHEHTRSDRDRHVHISWDNIRKFFFNNFRERPSDSLNTPYDYSSIMHYGRTAFAIDHHRDTITPVPDASAPIGQRDAMSPIDVLRVNKLYSCHAP